MSISELPLKYQSDVLPTRLADKVILASGNSPSNDGGMYAIGASGVTRLDNMSTMGLSMLPTGEFVRIAQPDLENHSESQLYIYDERGLVRYLRVDGLLDPHAIVPDGDLMAIASTMTDEIFWVDQTGRTVRTWWQGGSGDAAHLNCLYFSEHGQFASAFGRFHDHREWKKQLGHGAGVLIDLATNENVVEGLDAPHDAVIEGDHWLICNSAKNTLVRVNRATGEHVEAVDVGAWSRGLVVLEDLIVVGVSSRRAAGAGGGLQSGLVILDRETLRVVERLVVPVTEVFGLTVAPATIADGVRSEFQSQGRRIQEQLSQGALLAGGLTADEIETAGLPVSLDELDVRVSASGVPHALSAGSEIEIATRVAHNAGPMLMSLPPYPINLGFRWFQKGIEAGSHTPSRSSLPQPLRAGDSVEIPLTVSVPAEPGRYTLDICLVQEQICWFDSLAVQANSTHQVEVR